MHYHAEPRRGKVEIWFCGLVVGMSVGKAKAARTRGACSKYGLHVNSQLHAAAPPTATTPVVRTVLTLQNLSSELYLAVAFLLLHHRSDCRRCFAQIAGESTRWRSRVGHTGDWHGTGAPRTGHCSRTGDGAGEGVAEVCGHRQAPSLLAQGPRRTLHRPGEEKRVTIPNVAQVACEYRHQTGEDPPHRNLGLPSLTALLRSLPPNVCRLEQAPGWACFQSFTIAPCFQGRCDGL